MNSYRVILATVGVVFLAAGMRAQSITGSITGQVSDASGAPVPKVQITARNIDTGITTRAESEDSGTYVIADLQDCPHECVTASGRC
jgi:carboxypeptidase family protein